MAALPTDTNDPSRAGAPAAGDREWRLRQELHWNEEVRRTLFDLAPVGIVLVGPDGRIIAASERAASQLGYMRDELEAKSIPEIDVADRPGDFEARMERLGRGELVEFETHHRAKGGEVRTVHVRCRTLPVAGGPPCIVAVWTDVTRERSLADQLAQSQKMESLGRLAAGIAHDFNNLLSVLLTCSRTLRSDLASGRPPDPQDVEDVAAASGRAAELTRQLLAFARRQPIEPVPLDLNTELRGAERLLQRVLGSDVRFTLDLQPGLWTIRFDRQQLEQVLLNLGANARDAMPRSGNLTLGTANVRLDEGHPDLEPGVPPGEFVRLVVRDTGEGMSEEVLLRVFEPFFTTKQRGRGTGLGLATVYGIVRQAGGFIRVESAVGTGTTFRIFLPRLGDGEVAQPAAPVAVGAHAGSESILVVEDDPLVLQVTTRVLKGAGYRVRGCQEASEAARIPPAELREIRLVISDVIMPDLHGPTLVRELTRSNPALRCVFFSGQPRGEVEARGLLPPGADFVQKPFSPEELLARVRAALDRG